MTVENITSQPMLPSLDIKKTVGSNDSNLIHIDPNIIKQPKATSSKEELEKAIGSINDFVKTSNTHIQFKLHEKLNEYYITIVDDQSQEVIREIPSKKVLDVYAAMTEFIGLIVDRKI